MEELATACSTLGCLWWFGTMFNITWQIITTSAEVTPKSRLVVIPLFTGFYTSQVLQEFFHQQYVLGVGPVFFPLHRLWSFVNHKEALVAPQTPTTLTKANVLGISCIRGKKTTRSEKKKTCHSFVDVWRIHPTSPRFVSFQKRSHLQVTYSLEN